jgi:hypothetical protein
MKSKLTLIALLLPILVIPLILMGCGNDKETNLGKPNFEYSITINGADYSLKELDLPFFIGTTHDRIILNDKTYLLIPIEKSNAKGFDEKQGLKEFCTFANKWTTKNDLSSNLDITITNTEKQGTKSFGAKQGLKGRANDRKDKSL